MLSAWNPIDMPNMVLPPCHHSFQLYSDGENLDLMLQQRSADLFLGLPYDIAMYGLLLKMLAKGALMTPRRLTISLGDCHIYNNHLDQVKEQLSRNIRQLPRVELGCGIFERDDELILPKKEDIMLFDYNPHKPIKAELSVGT